MARPNVPAILLTVLAGLVGWWLWQNLEWRAEPGGERWTAAAQRNPFLAAERYLEALGMRSESSDQLDRLARLAEYRMMVIDAPERVLTPRRAPILRDWLEQGGHLVIAAPLHDESHPDPLLSGFGVKNTPSEYHTQLKVPPEDEPGQTAREPESQLQDQAGKKEYMPDQLAELDFDGMAHPLRVRFTTNRTLFHPALVEGYEAAADNAPPQPFYWDSNAAGVQIMQFEVGEGLLTVLTDINLWRNASIDQHDHAYLLEALAPGHGAVLWLRGAESPHITVLLWRTLPEAILAGGMLLLCWLWSRAWRFGPILAPLQTERRSLAEHLLAAATYHWQRGDAAALLQPVRDDLERHAQRVFPDYLQLDPSARCALLARHAGLDAGAIAAALTGPPAQQAESLYTQIATLQTLRQRL